MQSKPIGAEQIRNSTILKEVTKAKVSTPSQLLSVFSKWFKLRLVFLVTEILGEVQLGKKRVFSN